MDSVMEHDTDPRLARKRVPRAVSEVESPYCASLTDFSAITAGDGSPDVTVTATARPARALGKSSSRTIVLYVFDSNVEIPACHAHTAIQAPSKLVDQVVSLCFVRVSLPLF